MGQYTPGPWKITANNDAMQGRLVESGSGVRHLIASVWLTDAATDHRDANANLIAAAPDLLEALTLILEIGKRDLSNAKYDGYFDAARAAVAKAQGR